MIHKQTQIYKLQCNIKARQRNLYIPPCRDHCTNLVIWSITAKVSSITTPTSPKTTLSQANNTVLGNLSSMWESVLSGQPIEPTPWLDQEIPTQQIREWYYFRSLCLQQSLNSNQHDTRPPSQLPDSWNEEQLRRNLQISSTAAILQSHLGTWKAFLKLCQFMVSLLIDDWTSTALDNRLYSHSF